MLKNYLKLAWKVLLRRKFFTFISLFGIAFTLVVLTLVTALLDHVVAAYPPETNHAPHRRDLLRVTARRALRAGMDWPATRCSTSTRANLPNVEQMAVASMAGGVFSYLNGQRLKSYLKRTDGAFWQILDFQFLEGGPYTERRRRATSGWSPSSTRRRASDSSAGSRALGRTIEADGQRFTVVGVVPDVPILRIVPFADIWVPHTTAKSDSYTREYVGNFMGILLLEDPAKVALTRDEFWSRLRTVKPADPMFNRLEATPETLFDTIGRMFTGDGTRRWAPATAPPADRADRRRCAVHAAAGGEPDQPEHQPHHGARVRDWRAQGLRRVVAHAGGPVRRREPRAHAGRRRDRVRRRGAGCCRPSTPAA